MNKNIDNNMDNSKLPNSSDLTISEKDNSYWDKFYSENDVPREPSSFANQVISYIDKSKSILELGCGNARDAFFFARNGIKVNALDLSSEVVELDKKHDHELVNFEQKDFTKLSDTEYNEIGTVYSRFTLHSIDKESYTRTIEWCGRNLKSGSHFLIEARTTKDPFYGVGEKCPDNGYIDTHYRRFFDVQETIADLEKEGFKIISAIENYTDSWYKEDHAVVMRLICEKK